MPALGTGCGCRASSQVAVELVPEDAPDDTADAELAYASCLLKCEFQLPTCNQDACIDARPHDALNVHLFLALGS